MRTPATDWDVAIVGAGPAGSAAAIHLDARRHRVLLVDKDEFPRDKVCGDALIPDAIRALKRASVYQAVADRACRLSLGSVYSPSGVRFDVPGDYLTIKRIALDAILLQEAVARGALFRRAKVTRIEVGADGEPLLFSDGDGDPLRSRIAILATGAAVELPAGLGLVDQSGPSAVALRCYVRSGFELDRLIISYDRRITPGYAWIFPLGGGEYNVGCGVVYKNGNASGVNLRATLETFIEGFPLATELMRAGTSLSAPRGARLRCGLRGTRQPQAANLLLIGETIGATFPFTGEGIGKAMETGELAAQVAGDALASNDMSRLRRFSMRVEAELRPKFLGYQIAEDWLSRPWLNDFVARRIRRSAYLRQSIAALVNETVDPRAVFSLRGIVRSFVS